MTKSAKPKSAKSKSRSKRNAPKAVAPQVEADKLASAKAQGQAQFDSIMEMVEALEGWQAAAISAGWTGPHKDKFGVTYFECPPDEGEAKLTTYAAPNWRELCHAFDIEASDDNEDARRTIEEDALSVQIRSGWYSPGAQGEDTKPAEYEILLCTGGPACRIIGDLDGYGQPETAQIEVQDWFQPWTEMRPLVSKDNYDSEPILLAYARCFFFGEG